MDYPFAALVGQEQLKTALLVIAVNPTIGGVLIRGEKGTAKSTAARALAALLPPVRLVTGCAFHCDPDSPWTECPHCSALAQRNAVEMAVPFVDLPLGATEDRVLGSLDFERALREGRRAFQPGLLAAAHRGVLYIDEVNLLADHLVDVLLDAASMGTNTVEREGVAVRHPARFLLIGTMNPEEGNLRPQLLDRFGLAVQVVGPRDPGLRAEVVRRRLAFESDPAAFDERWADEQNALRERVVAARALLPGIVLEDGLLTLLTRLCCELDVDGLRADIVLHKTACALAALDGRMHVGLEDIRAAAELVLPHRRRRRPFERPELDREQLNEALSKMESQPDQEASGVALAPREKEALGALTQPRSPENEALGALTRPRSPENVFSPTPIENVRRIEVSATTARSEQGRRNRSSSRERGPYIRAVPDEAPVDVAIDATLRAAARHGLQPGGGMTIERCDLHRKERTGRTGTLILFVVDASGSMAARQRMAAVKGSVLGLLQSAYEQRDEVGVIAFRGPNAEVLLPPTRGIDIAEQTLRVLPTGGRTPLAHALVLARETIQQSQRSAPDRPVLLVLLSDGKANVGLPESPGDPWQQALQAAANLAADGTPALVLDTDASFVRVGRARQLADALGAEYLPLEKLSAETLILKVRQRMKG
ncbi:MAG TPA: putative cobaltochelatase [Gemmataceae bacterium]|nr:putative cobaltochelatase [Gemmataceae bacterium]